MALPFSTQSIGRAVFAIVTDSSAFFSDVARVKKEGASLSEIFENAGKRLKTFSEHTTQLGGTLTKLLTGPIIAAGAGILAFGVQYQNAMSTIAAKTGATGAVLKSLGTDFRAVFRQVPQDAQTVAAAIADLNIRLGLTGRPLQEATKRFLDFARVNKVDVAESTRVVTQAMNDLGISTDRLPEMLDKLTAASQASGISVTRLAALISESDDALAEMGFGLDESIALMAQLEKAGAEPTAVINGLTIALRNMAKEGVTDARQALTILLTRIKEAPSLVEASKIAVETFGKSGVKMAGDIRSGKLELDAMLKVVQTSKGTLEQSAAATLTFGEKLSVLKNRASEVLGPLGVQLLGALERLFPLIEGGLQIVVAFADAFTRLPQPVKTTAVALVAIAAAAGPALLILGQLASAVSSAMVALGLSGGAATKATVSFGGQALAQARATAASAALAAAEARLGAATALLDAATQKYGATSVQVAVAKGRQATASAALAAAQAREAAAVASNTAATAASSAATASAVTRVGLLARTWQVLLTPLNAATIATWSGATATGALSVAQGVLSKAATVVTGVVRTLWTALLAHPFVAITAAIGAATLALTQYYEASKQRQLQAQTEGATQDSINLAIQRGATFLKDATDKEQAYADAIKFNNNWLAIRLAQYNKSAEVQERARKAQLEMIDVELRLGKITQEQANLRRQQLQAEEQVAAVRKSNVGLAETIALTEKKIRDEITATGHTVPELTASLKKNEDGFKAWAKQVGLSPETLKFLEDSLKKTTKAATDADKPIDQFRKRLVELAAAIKNRDDLSAEGLVARFGADAQKAVADAADLKVALDTLPPAILAIAKAAGSVELGQILADAPKVISGINDIADALQNLDPMNAGVGTEMFNALIQAQDDAQHRMVQATKRGVDLRLVEINRAERDELASYERLKRADPERYAALVAATKAFYQQQRNLALGTADTIEARMEAQGVHTKAVLDRMAADAKRDYEQMKESGVFSSGELQAAWERMVNANITAQGRWTQTFTNWIGAIPGLLQQALTGGGGMGGFGKALSSMIGADLGKGLFTDGGLFGGFTKRLMSGTSALTGILGKTISGALGAAMPVIGAAIGALAGPLLEKIGGLFKKPEWKKVGEDVGRDLGVNISDGLAKEIAELAKTLKGGTKEQRRKLAEALSLDKIIEEGGGLTSANVQKFEKQAMSLFDAIKKGGEEGAQATSTLNSLIGKFAAQAETTGGVWSATFQQLIARSKELGLNLEGVTAAIEGQINKLGGGLAAALKGAFSDTETAFATLTKNLTAEQIAALSNVEQRTKILQDLQRSGATEQAAAFATAIKEFDSLQGTAQEKFERLSRIALASFNAMIAGGKSSFEAMASIGPAIDQLIAQHNKLGLTGGAAFDQLARFRELTAQNADLVASVGGLNDVMVALGNLGGLTAEAFADLQAQGVSAFQQMLAAGFTEQEALAALAPMLQTILKLHQERGLAIDDETQALITQAQANGVLKEQISMQDILLEGFGALITAVGGQLPEAFKRAKKAADDAAKAAQGVADSVNDIPDNVEIEINYRGGPPPEFNLGEGREVQFERGGVVRPLYRGTGGGIPPLVHWKPKGTDTVPAMLTPKEGVVTVDGMERLGPEGLEAINRGKPMPARRLAKLALPKMADLAKAAAVIAAVSLGSPAQAAPSIQRFATGGIVAPGSGQDISTAILQLERMLQSIKSAGQDLSAAFAKVAASGKPAEAVDTEQYRRQLEDLQRQLAIVSQAVADVSAKLKAAGQSDFADDLTAGVDEARASLLKLAHQIADRGGVAGALEGSAEKAEDLQDALEDVQLPPELPGDVKEAQGAIRDTTGQVGDLSDALEDVELPPEFTEDVQQAVGDIGALAGTTERVVDEALGSVDSLRTGVQGVSTDAQAATGAVVGTGGAITGAFDTAKGSAEGLRGKLGEVTGGIVEVGTTSTTTAPVITGALGVATGSAETLRLKLAEVKGGVDGVGIAVIATPWGQWATTAAGAIAVIIAQVDALLVKISTAHQAILNLPIPTGPAPTPQPGPTPPGQTPKPPPPIVGGPTAPAPAPTPKPPYFPPRIPVPSPQTPRIPVPDINIPHIPVPGGTRWWENVRTMAEGGFGRVTMPTLFMAGEAGPEAFAFSGANRDFSTNRGGGGDINIDVNGIRVTVQGDVRDEAHARAIGQSAGIRLAEEVRRDPRVRDVLGPALASLVEPRLRKRS